MRPCAPSPLPAVEEPERLLITVKKARELLSLGHGKIYELLADGSLESVKVGRRRLSHPQALDALQHPHKISAICAPQNCDPARSQGTSWRRRRPQTQD